VLEGTAQELQARNDIKAFYLGLGTPHRSGRRLDAAAA
jgi:hypothetical protein